MILHGLRNASAVTGNAGIKEAERIEDATKESTKILADLLGEERRQLYRVLAVIDSRTRIAQDLHKALSLAIPRDRRDSSPLTI